MAKIKPIPNEDLRRADVPERDTEWKKIVRFARTFDGYELFGLHYCAELGNLRRECKSLSELRACLYFEYRRYKQFQSTPGSEKMVRVNELLDRIRELAKEGTPSEIKSDDTK